MVLKHSSIPVMAVVLATLLLTLPGKAQAQQLRDRNEDLVNTASERWIDSLKGTANNFGSELSRDVTIAITLHDQRNSVIGRQTVSVDGLRSGESTNFSMEVKDEHRRARTFGFRPHAI